MSYFSYNTLVAIAPKITEFSALDLPINISMYSKETKAELDLFAIFIFKCKLK